MIESKYIVVSVSTCSKKKSPWNLQSSIQGRLNVCPQNPMVVSTIQMIAGILLIWSEFCQILKCPRPSAPQNKLLELRKVHHLFHMFVTQALPYSHVAFLVNLLKPSFFHHSQHFSQLFPPLPAPFCCKNPPRASGSPGASGDPAGAHPARRFRWNRLVERAAEGHAAEGSGAAVGSYAGGNWRRFPLRNISKICDIIR